MTCGSESYADTTRKKNKDLDKWDEHIEVYTGENMAGQNAKPEGAIEIQCHIELNPNILIILKIKNNYSSYFCFACLISRMSLSLVPPYTMS